MDFRSASILGISHVLANLLNSERTCPACPSSPPCPGCPACPGGTPAVPTVVASGAGWIGTGAVLLLVLCLAVSLSRLKLTLPFWGARGHSQEGRLGDIRPTPLRRRGQGVLED
eukprot:713692-Amphidinium_carterae.1